jgi:hypothetical protein
MTWTVFGCATDVGAVSQLPSGLGGYAIDSYEPELAGTTIDCDHDNRPVGEIIHAELTPGNQLAVVGVVDGLDFAEIDRPVYWSGSYYPADPPHDRQRSFLVGRAHVGGMALTFRSANTSAKPLRWMPGDVRSGLDRSRWPISWRSANPLLARAHDHQGGMRTRSAPRIVDRRFDPRLEQLVGRSVSSLDPAALDLLHDQHQRPPGPLRHSAPMRGSVIRVH